MRFLCVFVSAGRRRRRMLMAQPSVVLPAHLHLLQLRAQGSESWLTFPKPRALLPCSHLLLD